MEVITEVETAASAAAATAQQERTKPVDLAAAPDAKVAHEAVVVAELTRTPPPYCAAARRLVRTPWARQRILSLADALLRHHLEWR